MELNSSGFILSLIALLRLDWPAIPLGNAGQSHLPEDRFGIYRLRDASSSRGVDLERIFQDGV